MKRRGFLGVMAAVPGLAVFAPAVSVYVLPSTMLTASRTITLGCAPSNTTIQVLWRDQSGNERHLTGRPGDQFLVDGGP